MLIVHPARLKKMAPIVIGLSSLLASEATKIGDQNIESCFTCGKTGAQTHSCNTCGAAYCRKKCQRDDFVLHSVFCKQLGDFSTEAKPSSQHYRALGFAPDDEKPALIWLEGLDDPHLVSIDDPTAEESTENIAKTRSAYMVQRGDRVLILCVVKDGGANRAALNLSGKPGQAWMLNGHALGFVMKKDGGGSVVGPDDLTARDFRDMVNALRSSAGNAAILPEHVPLHVTSCIQALKFNDEATIKEFEEMGLPIPAVEHVWVPTILRAGKTIDDYCHPLCYAFFVGLKWYVRRAPYSAASLARIRSLKDPDESARSIHSDAIILMNYIEVEYGANSMPRALYPLVGQLAGPVLVLHSSGARIDQHHVRALRAWASNVDPEGNKIEKDFRKYWDVYKAEQVQKGLMPEGFESPYDLQDAAGPALIHADRDDMKNPERVKICLDIFAANEDKKPEWWQYLL